MTLTFYPTNKGTIHLIIYFFGRFRLLYGNKNRKWWLFFILCLCKEQLTKFCRLTWSRKRKQKSGEAEVCKEAWACSRFIISLTVLL